MKTFKEYLIEKKKSTLNDKIVDFVKNTKNIDDEKLHAFAEKLGKNIHKVESFIYSELQRLLKKDSDK
jgi:hypothetical protein